MTESYVWYTSFTEAIECLPEAEQGAAFLAIHKYAEQGIEPVNLNGAAKAIFILIKPQIDSNRKRRENGSKGGRPTSDDTLTETKPEPKNNQTVTEEKPNNNLMETKPEPNVNVNVNDNVNVNEKEKDAKASQKKSLRFSPPTLDEVKAYCTEKSYHIDAEHFIAHYTANGWTQGRGKPIKDWRACVVTWTKNDAMFNNSNSPPKYQKPNAKPGFEQRPFDEQVEKERRIREMMKQGERLAALKKTEGSG